MSSRSRRSFTLLVRSVSSEAGSEKAPWMTSDETFGGVGGARDYVQWLPAPRTDCVIRVRSEGDSRRGEEGRVRVVEDWLWDLREEGPVVIPWDRSEAEWADKKPWIDAWDSCTFPTWLVGAAVSFGRRDIAVRGACGCLRAALPLLAGDEDGLALRDVTRLIDGLEMWSDGRVDAAYVYELREAIRDTEADDFDANYVVMAARELASSVGDDVGDLMLSIEDIARARGLYNNSEDDFDDPSGIMASDFRQAVGTLAFLRAAAGLPR